jgi:hypothetical protein
MSLWNWQRHQERWDDSRVEQQLHEYGCGAACVVMLLADRGIVADQLSVMTGLHLPSTAQELAQRLNELSGSRSRWLGGHLDLDPPFELKHLIGLGENGSWAVLLVPSKLREGHWVVVDEVVDAMTVAVRDPVGSSYHLNIQEFLHLIRYMVVVVETGGS